MRMLFVLLIVSLAACGAKAAPPKAAAQEPLSSCVPVPGVPPVEVEGQMFRFSEARLSVTLPSAAWQGRAGAAQCMFLIELDRSEPPTSIKMRSLIQSGTTARAILEPVYLKALEAGGKQVDEITGGDRGRWSFTFLFADDHDAVVQGRASVEPLLGRKDEYLLVVLLARLDGFADAAEEVEAMIGSIQPLSR